MVVRTVYKGGDKKIQTTHPTLRKACWKVSFMDLVKAILGEGQQNGHT